jgi:hypothetical protein
VLFALKDTKTTLATDAFGITGAPHRQSSGLGSGKQSNSKIDLKCDARWLEVEKRQGRAVVLKVPLKHGTEAAGLDRRR